MVRYHAVSILLHWLMALALIAMLAVGLTMEHYPGALRPLAYGIHKALGLTLLVLAVGRLGWRFYRPPPPPVAGLPAWQRHIAGITHAAFYVLMLLLPLSGWAMVSASTLGIPTSWFGLFTWPNLPLPQDRALRDQFYELHELLAYGMISLLMLHIGAAWWHHWRLRDATLNRMAPWLPPRSP